MVEKHVFKNRNCTSNRFTEKEGGSARIYDIIGDGNLYIYRQRPGVSGNGCCRNVPSDEVDAVKL